MKIERKYIISFLALLFYAGISLSAFHFHASAINHFDNGQPEIVQDHNYCILCASQFKSTPTTDFENVATLNYEPFYFDVQLQPVAKPLCNIKNYRAPPLSV